MILQEPVWCKLLYKNSLAVGWIRLLFCPSQFFPNQPEEIFMTTQIALQQHALGRMIGMRSTAVPIRKSIELALEKEQDVVINFTGVEVTQSFIDELIGALILRDGPEIMQRLILKGCSEQTRAIIRFVAADRAEQFMLAVH